VGQEVLEAVRQELEREREGEAMWRKLVKIGTGVNKDGSPEGCTYSCPVCAKRPFKGVCSCSVWQRNNAGCICRLAANQYSEGNAFMCVLAHVCVCLRAFVRVARFVCARDGVGER